MIRHQTHVADTLLAICGCGRSADFDFVLESLGRTHGAAAFDRLACEIERYLTWITGSPTGMPRELSGAYRNGRHGAGEATALAAVPMLKASHGVDRLIWGSDWPHTLFEQSANYTTERQLLDAWLADSAERDIVLRRTPQALFRFAA